MINAGKYNKKIEIIEETTTKNANGFPVEVETIILTCYAEIKTTSGMKLITNNSDFEKAYVRFTIRKPKIDISRQYLIKYKEEYYSIEYINNFDENNIEIELQTLKVTK